MWLLELIGWAALTILPVFGPPILIAWWIGHFRDRRARETSDPVEQVADKNAA
jgi:hypothetical protein